MNKLIRWKQSPFIKCLQAKMATLTEELLHVRNDKINLSLICWEGLDSYHLIERNATRQMQKIADLKAQGKEARSLLKTVRREYAK